MTSRVARRLLACLALSASLIIPTGVRALAHAHYQNSAPENGAVVGAAPSSVTINFDDNLDPQATTVQVIGPNGANVATKTSVKEKTAVVSLINAGAGTYTVKWHAVADDDKGVTDGTFTFRAGAAAAPARTPSNLPRTGGDHLLGLSLAACVLVAAGTGLRRMRSMGS